MAMAMAMLLVACGRAEESRPVVDHAEQILAGAQRALGVDTAEAPFQVMADAAVRGPGGSFRTRVHSASDGRVRMEQRPSGFVAGVGASGGWPAGALDSGRLVR